MSDPIHVPVLIVGGGIVGLSASLFLSHQGTHSLLIERHSSTSIHPRGRGVNSRTMELYRSIGVSTAIRDAGASLSPSGGIYSGTTLREAISPTQRIENRKPFPLAGLVSGVSPEPGQWGTQDMMEPVLLQAAKERGVDARFFTECVSVEQDEEKVIATLRDRKKDETYTVTADYCIAADGANSPIRENLKIARTGQGSLGNLLNILFHADLSEFVKNREFSICKIQQSSICGMFTAINNSDRWVFHLVYDPMKGEEFTPETCKEIVRQALGMPEVEINIKSILPWQASERVADRLQVERIFLAGDAAHQMTPYAGQGANSGISDAHNLAWKLAAVLKGHTGKGLLETYETERLPVGQFAAEVSRECANEKGLIDTNFRLKLAKSLVKRMPIMSGFGYFYGGRGMMEESRGPIGGWSWTPWTLPSLGLGLDGRPGSRAPHVWVERYGKRISTLDLLGNGFVLLAGSEGGQWVEAAAKVEEKLQGMAIRGFVLGPTGNIMDPDRGFETAAGISSTGVMLARPDGFVAWRERRKPVDCEKRLKEVMLQVLCL
ncbi:Tetracenomycin polyketide synthesis hydroxylase TcmG [Lachnellula suecica]|uniref:Tetracenomycin polyketide synthesis hydroxylase TcmG n=1 Tax=Lachnellula suecica TaxID=602035 RepID=A0A8T9CCX4_9HELO|nr:Tetracenomycin polyketide synthesis hydroxylase TcmG [Lachnellula suecica]